MKLTEKVQRVCIARIQPCDLLEGIDSRVGLRKRSISDAQVVPGPRALRFAPGCIKKNIPRLGKLLAVQQCNAFV